MINELVQQFNGTKTSNDTVTFSSGDSDFALTDGTLYQVVDGALLPGGQKVRTMAAARKFVALCV